MAEPVSSLIAFSDHAAALVESASASIVAVHSGGRWSSSGIHWRPNVIVTAEEVLERDEELTVTLPGGGKVAASLAGRDPSTDVAALRIVTGLADRSHRGCRNAAVRPRDPCGRQL
jgi:S1-C subfamily serine protease